MMMNQFASIYSVLSNIRANDRTLSEIRRSYLITVANLAREALEVAILHRLKPELLNILLTALIVTDYNLAAFGCYPRAVDMLLTQARRPRGPYELIHTVHEVAALRRWVNPSLVIRGKRMESSDDNVCRT